MTNNETIHRLEDEIRGLKVQIKSFKLDVQTSLKLFTDLLNDYKDKLEDTRLALEACKQQLAAITHSNIDLETIGDLYQELSSTRSQVSTDLELKLQKASDKNKMLELELRRLKKQYKHG